MFSLFGRNSAAQVARQLGDAVPPCLKHWARFAFRPSYRTRRRELRRLHRLARYTPTTTDLLGEPFELLDGLSFVHTHHAIFEREIYRFKTPGNAPYIIDGGANVGLSVAYFKRLFPQGRILAFEPDPAVFRVLRRNCASLGLQDVLLLDRALWSSETSLCFESEGADAGRIVAEGSSPHSIRVPAVRLKSYLGRRVDFLKLDIEGAETEVLQDCRDALGGVDRLFVEFHSFEGKPQSLHNLLGVLDGAGFRLQVHESMVSPQPFLSRPSYLGMDLQLNIFAFRTPGTLKASSAAVPCIV